MLKIEVNKIKHLPPRSGHAGEGKRCHDTGDERKHWSHQDDGGLKRKVGHP